MTIPLCPFCSSLLEADGRACESCGLGGWQTMAVDPPRRPFGDLLDVARKHERRWAPRPTIPNDRTITRLGTEQIGRPARDLRGTIDYEDEDGER